MNKYVHLWQYVGNAPQCYVMRILPILFICVHEVWAYLLTYLLTYSIEQIPSWEASFLDNLRTLSVTSYKILVAIKKTK
jgi:peptidoglycan/LPS O-acetylase OafA/YrhL